MRQKCRTSLFGAVLTAVSFGCMAGAGAAGFALSEQSGSGLGNAFAGAAASAEDASTIFFNPAGMSFLPGAQMVVAGHAVNLSMQFTDSGSSVPAGLPPGGNGGNAGDLLFIPNLYFAIPVGRFSFGIGANAPFGLKTEYDASWVGRFQGIKSELTTVNVNPAIAYKINEVFSIGAGVNYQSTDGELTNAVLLAPATPGLSKLEADDDAWGWNVGMLAQISPDMRIGASYRSPVKYRLAGDITVTNAAGALVPAASGPAQADITFPDMFSVSVAQKYSDKWDILGDITFTRWNQVDIINIVNPNSGAVRDQLVFKLENSWRVSLGLNYHHNDRWTFKSGVAWDQSPVSDQYRTVRLPDNDRYWFALGAKYRVNKSLAFDMGYTHLFVRDASINLSRTTSTVRGDYESSVDIVSLQLTYTF